MTDKTDRHDVAHALREALRSVRRRYDQLDRGKTAQIRRCRTADDVALEGAYWKIGETLAYAQRHLPHVVLLYPMAPHASISGRRFSFGRYLRRQIGDSDGATLRFRRLLDSRDREELDHRLRGILRLAAGDHAPVDWGSSGRTSCGSSPRATAFVVAGLRTSTPRHLGRRARTLLPPPP